MAQQVKAKMRGDIGNIDLPLLSGPPFKLEFGGYGRPTGLTVTQ